MEAEELPRGRLAPSPRRDALSAAGKGRLPHRRSTRYPYLAGGCLRVSGGSNWKMSDETNLFLDSPFHPLATAAHAGDGCLPMSREPPMGLSMIAIIGIPRTMALFVGIVLGLASCAQQGENLPEFPHYRPADDFLEMQHSLASFTRSRPQPDASGKRNEEISRDLERRLSNAKSLEMRARQREEALLRRRLTSQRDFAALQERLARSAALRLAEEAQ